MTVHSNTMKDEYHRLAQHVYDKVLGSNENTPTSPYYYYWIGLAGGPGSGKTTVATAVADRINDRFQTRIGNRRYAFTIIENTTIAGTRKMMIDGDCIPTPDFERVAIR